MGIKKSNIYILFGVLFLLLIPVNGRAEILTIQQQIDASKPGDTIEIAEGQYVESLIIKKPIHLVGTGDVTIVQNESFPTITIQSDNVVLKNLNVKYTGNNHESPAILMNSNGNTLHQLIVTTTGVGIQLDQANNNKLSDIKVTGNKNELIKNRNHGIDLWESHNNEIYETYIDYVLDGIYVERSHTNKIYRNNLSYSRYGIHLMFTKDTELITNESHHNVSGMYIMGTDGTIAKQNKLTENQENIQSLGLLLFDTVNAVIEENDIVSNRIGILIESASNNTIDTNNVQGNYIGIQFKSAENNNIMNNSFVANVVQGQAKESTNNFTNGNYWGDHHGLDITGNHTSDIPYKVDPFFLNITNEYPVFQLLFQAPGMVFLEQLISTPIDEQLVDYEPLLKSPIIEGKDSPQNNLTILLFCMILLVSSIYITYLGVKKQ